MGKGKLKIRRLETVSARQNTFAKRKNGIMKKVNELSILCDILVLVLMFTPSGNPILSLGENNELNSVLTKYAMLNPHEKAQRKKDTLKILKKMLEKINEDFDKETWDESLDREQQTAALRNQLLMLQSQIDFANYRLSLWTGTENLCNLDLIKQMKESIVKSLGLLQDRKEQLAQME